MIIVIPVIQKQLTLTRLNIQQLDKVPTRIQDTKIAEKSLTQSCYGTHKLITV